MSQIVGKPAVSSSMAMGKRPSLATANPVFEKKFKGEVSEFFNTSLLFLSPKKGLFLKSALDTHPSWQKYSGKLSSLQWWKYAPASEMPILNELVEDVALASGCKKPEVCVSYATGTPLIFFKPVFSNTPAICFEDMFLVSLHNGKFSLDEARAILAHEFGHMKKRHITKNSVFRSALLYGVPAAIGASVGIIAFSGLPLALAIVPMAVGGAIFGLGGAMSNAIGRSHEYAADKFAGRVAGARHLISYFEKMRGSEASMQPGVVHSLGMLDKAKTWVGRFFAGARIETALSYAIHVIDNYVAESKWIQKTLEASRSTHPKFQKRIARLEKIREKQDLEGLFQEAC